MPASKNSKSSPTSKRKPVAVREPLPWRLLLALTLISAVAILFFLSKGYLLWYGDASAHLNNARRILDSRTPGYEQIGTVWLPLPHLLMLPLVTIDPLWRSGIAASIPSGICFIAAGLFLYGAARRVYDSTTAGAAAALLFALNPNMLYLQSLAMTEAVFAAAAAMTLYGTVKRSGWVTGFGLLAATMTRYDGWFLIPFAILYLAFHNFRGAILAGCIASIGPLYWLAHNAIFMGDPLEFYWGVGSAKWIYEQGVAKGQVHPADHHWRLAAEYYWAAARLFVAPVLLGAGALGACVALVRRAWWPLAFMVLTPFFYIWSMYGSGNPIHVPMLPPNSYYNTRYAMAVLPLAAFAAAALVTLAPERFQRWMVGALVGVTLIPWISYPSPQSWITWKESEVNSTARRAWTQEAAEYLSARYETGTGIVTQFGDLMAIYREAGIPFRQTLNECNGIQFEAVLKRPDLFLWQEWVVAIQGDDVSRAMERNAHKLPRYRRVRIVEVKDAPPVEIWRRSRK